MRVLGIAGSLRQDSHNSRLLAVAGALPPAPAGLGVFAGLRSVAPFDQDAEASAPLGVSVLRRAIAEADAVLFATPEYNSSIPGCSRTLSDWASRPRAQAALANKPVAVVGASTGMFGAVWAGRAAQGARRHRGPSSRSGAGRAQRRRGVHHRGGLVEAGQELELASLLIELSEMVSLRPVA